MASANIPQMTGQLVGSLTSNFLVVIEQLNTANIATLDMLRKLKAGEISVDRIMVTDDGWTLMPPPPVRNNANNTTKEKVEVK